MMPHVAINPCLLHLPKLEEDVQNCIPKILRGFIDHNTQTIKLPLIAALITLEYISQFFYYETDEIYYDKTVSEARIYLVKEVNKKLNQVTRSWKFEIEELA